MIEMDQIAKTDTLRKATETAVLSAIGALAFTALNIPAGVILGAMTVVAIGALAGRPLGFAPAIRAPQLAVMGLAAGASVTPAALEAAGKWPASIIVLLIVTALMQYAAYLIFRRLGRFDPMTAFLAAAPGSLSAVLILAEDERADVPRVAVAQTLRVTCIVAMTPFLLTGARPLTDRADTAMIHGPEAWILLLLAAGAGWLGARRLRWPMPAFMGTLIGSAALHCVGVVGVRPPDLLMALSQAGLGGVIGSRFCGLTLKEIASLFPVSFLALAVTACIGIGSGLLIGDMLGIGSFPALLAFSPGSMEMMIAVALATDMLPAYVAAHHVTRTLVLLASVPLVAKKIRR